MNRMLQLLQGAIDMKLMVQWAVTSAVLILIVLAARYALRDKLSARWRYALWGIVLLRLLVPFQIELPASAPVPVLASSLAQDVTPWLDDTMLYAVPTEDQPTDKAPVGLPPGYARNGFYGNWEYYSGGEVYDGEHITRYAFMMTALEVVIMIWIAGAALTALVILLSNLRFAYRLKKQRKKLEGVFAGGQCPPLQDAPIPVYVAEGLPSPCLFGAFRPAVYVTPEAAENPDTLRHVLAHELTHYAHRDHVWSLLRCLALALHWYDPLVWLAVGLSKKDGELACDEGAIARLGEAERIPYGRTLVDMVAARSSRPGDLLSCSTAMTGGEKSIQRRVAQIVKKPETVKAALFAAIAVVALSVVFVFAERGPAQRESEMLPDFLDCLDRAAAIRYAPPAHSDRAYPEPIQREDLLAEAKEILSHFRYLEPGDPQPDLSPEKLLYESRIILTFEDDEDGGPNWSLLWQNDHTYLFPGSVWAQSVVLQEREGETAQLQGVSGTCISKQGKDVIAALQNLAQGRPGWTGWEHGLERYLSQVESAAAIYYYDPNPFHADEVYPDPILDEDLLPNAKARLSDLIPIEQLDPGDPAPDLSGAGHARQVTLCPDTDRTRGHTYRLLVQGGYTYLLPLGEDTVLARSAEPDDISEFIKTLANTEYGRRLRREDPDRPAYEDLDPIAFAASLRSKDIMTVYRASAEHGYMPWYDGFELGELMEQLAQATDHQLQDTYSQEKYGQYALVIRMLEADGRKAGGIGVHDELSLSLSIGEVEDVICLSHGNYGYNGGISARAYVYSPELYQMLPPLFEVTPDMVRLTPEQIAQVNEAFLPEVEYPDGSYGPSEISCFFTSNYSDTLYIDLEEFLRYCPLAEEVTKEQSPEEYRDVLEASPWAERVPDLDDFLLPVPMHRYPREKVSALLEKYTARPVENLDWSNCLYLEKYDAFYNFTSDYGPGTFHCEGGEMFGDGVRLWTEADGNGERRELNLRKGRDRWLITSLRTFTDQ